jgi:hypothetical protein
VSVCHEGPDQLISAALNRRQHLKVRPP